MSAPPPAPDVRPEHASRVSSDVGPLAVWLGAQLTVLALAAAQVPLSARFVRPAERVAIEEMLVAQVTVAAMLFPVLLPSARSTVLAALASLPFVQLASYLSVTPLSRAALAGAYVVTWIAALALWARALRDDARAQLTGIAIATALTLGGPIAWYLTAEFSGAPAVVNWATQGAWGPLMGALAQVRQQAQIEPWPWVFVAAALAAGALVAWGARRRSRQVGG